MDYFYSDNILNKWKTLILACKNYYVDSVPTGLTDSEFDELENRAVIEDNFFVRDYVFNKYLKGSKTKNYFIEKIKKEKVQNISMINALIQKKLQLNNIYCDLKYDGTSIAVYIDPNNGVPKRAVTVGNLNIDNLGVDQTWKLLQFLPKRFPRGIVAIQCEALIDLENFEGDPDTARQKANGLINSSKSEALEEVNNLLTLRAYRYYVDPSIGGLTGTEDYRTVLKSFDIVRDKSGRILFSPADVWTVDELSNYPGYTETDKTKTSTGTFLNDGWVLYSPTGSCIMALKYSGAGSGTEVIKTKVKSIQWNDQTTKGKDSWSANIIIDPVTIKGCSIRKPSAGSVKKLVQNNITPGATVSIILANSTIPMVGKVLSPGNGDFMWPTCTCGYKLSSNDIYGSLLKCGNVYCSERLSRMKHYLDQLPDISYLDLNQFLVIDRFKWENTNIDLNKLLKFVEDNNEVAYYGYLASFMKTELQLKNLNLVYKASFKALRDFYERGLKI